MNIINKNKKLKLIVDIDNINRRIDNYIFSNFKKIPKSLIYKYIRTGIIKINNNKIIPKYKLKENDIIEFPDFKLNILEKNNFFFSKKEHDLILNKILYEDDYLLIINKPYGISVHGGKNNYKNIISIINCINNNKKINLVHRLDKETSGILILSKNINVLRNLHDQFNKNLIKRKYVALVNGIWNVKNHIVNINISKVKLNNKNISILNINGKNSCSIFKINKKFSKFTLINIELITGRFHQIRIQTKYCGNHIVCDKIYGLKKNNLKVKNMGLNRLFLHANYVEFIHPIYNKKICIYSDIDNELSSFIEKII